jgi:hypothetical protein
MDRLMQECFHMLRDIYPNVSMEPTTPLDHFYTDGTACGSAFKLVFTAEKGGYMNTVYVYPNGSWVSLLDPKAVAEYMQAWRKKIAEIFDPAAIKARTQERTRALKEEIVAEAFKPSRIEAALAAGVEVEDL